MMKFLLQEMVDFGRQALSRDDTWAQGTVMAAAVILRYGSTKDWNELRL
jgi:hypothetical protein